MGQGPTDCDPVTSDIDIIYYSERSGPAWAMKSFSLSVIMAFLEWKQWTTYDGESRECWMCIVNVWLVKPGKMPNLDSIRFVVFWNVWLFGGAIWLDDAWWCLMMLDANNGIMSIPVAWSQVHAIPRSLKFISESTRARDPSRSVSHCRWSMVTSGSTSSNSRCIPRCWAPGSCIDAFCQGSELVLHDLCRPRKESELPQWGNGNTEKSRNESQSIPIGGVFWGVACLFSPYRETWSFFWMFYSIMSQYVWYGFTTLRLVGFPAAIVTWPPPLRTVRERLAAWDRNGWKGLDLS